MATTQIGSRSVGKALATLEALAVAPRPVSAGALARSLKLARPTVYRILSSLADHGYVTHDRQRGLYRLSFKLLDLGHQALKGTYLLQAARPALAELQEQCRETVHLGVPEGGRMVYLDKLEGAGPFCMHSRIGASVPMHCTALGKAVLAFLPRPAVEAIVAAHGLPRRTPRTLVTWPALEQELTRVRQRGYAVDDVEMEEDVRCIGAPVFDYQGGPVAALSVSAPTVRMPLARARAVGGAVCESARAVSRAMGWSAAHSRVT